jgi:hypothetical protein
VPEYLALFPKKRKETLKKKEQDTPNIHILSTVNCPVPVTESVLLNPDLIKSFLAFVYYNLFNNNTTE